MYKEAIENYPKGLPGQLAKYSGCENILPFRAEGDDCQAGVFAFDGTILGKTIVAKASSDTARPIGVIMRAPFKTNIGAPTPNYYLDGSDIQIVNDCYIWVTPTNASSYKDKVYVKPTTGEIKTSSEDTVEGFVDTGFRVITPNEINCVAEITDKNF